MSEITMYEAQKKKLDGLCEEHDLTYRIRKDTYPITLTIRPIQGAAEQLSLLEKTDGEDYISPNASMKWLFSDGELTSKVEGGTFTISKVLRTKIENIFLKMISFWQQYFFRYLITNGTTKWVGAGYHINTNPEELVRDILDGIEAKRAALGI